MTTLLHRLHGLRGLLIAFVALALSAGLAFGAQPDASAKGLANAAAHAGKTVPVEAGDESTDEDTDEDTDESTDESEDSSDAGTHCATDPSTLMAEDLAAANHGSIVCWAAQQTEWPEWFANHGAFVKCWAHQGKADARSCTTAPAAEATATSHGNGKGKGQGQNR